jgi:hypothetical protein
MAGLLEVKHPDVGFDGIECVIERAAVSGQSVLDNRE